MVLFTGRTVEIAIDKGLKELGLPRMKAHIKVISREKRGFLGFGKKLAQVEIEPINEATAHKADQKAVRGVPDSVNRQNEPVTSQKEDAISLHNVVKLQKKAEAETVATSEEIVSTDPANISKPLVDNVVPIHKKSVPEVTDSADMDNISEENTHAVLTASPQSFEEFVANEFDAEDLNETPDIEAAAQDVLAYVEKIIYEMDVEASIESSHNRRHINLQIETPEAGRVIGYHGKVLKSLQLLAQNFLHDHHSKIFSVSLNVHDYLEQRTETLNEFAEKIAQRVLNSGRDYTMDPMSNSERKIIHKAITRIEGVDSYSEGSDPNRYVVVTLAR